jgi:hypothetical protein
MLAEDYRREGATLSKQVANLHKLLGNTRPPTFSLSSTTVAGHRSGLVDVLPPCQLSTADWPVLGRVPSPKASSPSLESGAVLDPTNQPWRYVTRCGSRRRRPLATGSLHWDVESGTDTEQKQLCHPGSRGSAAFYFGDFAIKFRSGYLHLHPLFYPGPRVQDITRLLPTVITQIPGADTVVVHVGSNDNRRASSEHLKIDFMADFSIKRLQKKANTFWPSTIIGPRVW